MAAVNSTKEGDKDFNNGTLMIMTLKMKRNKKGKFQPRKGHEGPEVEQRYSSTLSLTSALDTTGSLTPRHGRFTHGKVTRYPSYRKLSGPQGRSGRDRKM